MKKIGIMTLFNNNNFGAALQAYALQYLLNSHSYECEDISYSRVLPEDNNITKIKKAIVTIKNMVFHPVSMLRIRKKREHLNVLLIKILDTVDGIIINLIFKTQ